MKGELDMDDTTNVNFVEKDANGKESYTFTAPVAEYSSGITEEYTWEKVVS